MNILVDNQSVIWFAENNPALSKKALGGNRRFHQSLFCQYGFFLGNVHQDEPDKAEYQRTDFG
jgi:hypothetical protein